MNGLSSQTLALFLVLSPGFLFIAGTYFAPLTYPTRIDLQRGVVVDTAIFVVVSAMLHGIIGVPFLFLVNHWSSCNVVRSLAADASLTMARAGAGRCSVPWDFAALAIYSALLCVVAIALGRLVAWLLARSPRFFYAVYGPYYEVVSSKAYVIADVMTKTIHDGRALVYEGELIELSLNGSRGINFVCLQGASRFYVSLSRDAARTSARNQFQSIDKNSRPISRITIPGSEIVNLVTRTRPDVVVDDAGPASLTFTRRSILKFQGFFGGGQNSL